MAATIQEIVYAFLQTYYGRMRMEPSKVANLYTKAAEATFVNYGQVNFERLDFKETILPTVKLTGRDNVNKFYIRNQRNVRDLKIKIDTCDFQTTGQSHQNILIMIVGELFWTNTPTYQFTQTFILIPASKNNELYDISNDILRFIPETYKEIEIIQEPNSDVRVEETQEVKEAEDVKEESVAETVPLRKWKGKNEEEGEESGKEEKEEEEKIREDQHSEHSKLSESKKSTLEEKVPIHASPPVKMSWAAKLGTMDVNRENKKAIISKPIESTKKDSKKEKKNELGTRKENVTGRTKKKNQKEASYPIYITRPEKLSVDEIKIVFEKEFGPIVKLTSGENFAVVDFQSQTSQNNAIERRKVTVRGIHLSIEKKTSKKPVVANTVSQKQPNKKQVKKDK